MPPSPIEPPPADPANQPSSEPASQPREESGLALKTRPKVARPALYKVLLLNDDFTPMDFVVRVLEQFFQKAHEDALEIMLNVHRLGVGLCGIYSREVAETKVAQVLTFAREHQHPLQCAMEKE